MMVVHDGLVQKPYQPIADWGFLDACLNFQADVILSTIKIRKAGFSEAVDSMKVCSGNYGVFGN